MTVSATADRGAALISAAKELYVELVMDITNGEDLGALLKLDSSAQCTDDSSFCTISGNFQNNKKGQIAVYYVEFKYYDTSKGALGVSHFESDRRDSRGIYKISADSEPEKYIFRVRKVR
ncbi:MAG TPA: hypothetical protein VI968_03865 [archaeon]|nr:hypothetical protein [archaeon]